MATITQKGLGRGLSALISENASKPLAQPSTPMPTQSSDAAASGVYTLPVNKLQPGKYQPRAKFGDDAIAELATSIKKNGIMQPIIVRASGHPGQYEIVAGERRWRAAQQAGLSEVPVIIRDIPDKQALELAIIENVQRQDLSSIEEANGYQRLIEEFDYTQDELATTIGKSRSHVANLLRLLSLPVEIIEMLEKNELTAGHARALIGIPNAVELAQKIVKNGLNVRQVEQLSRDVQGAAKRTSSPRGQAHAFHPVANRDPDIIALEEMLSQNLGLKVQIQDRGQNGDILISYDSLSQLDDVIRRLSEGA